MRLGDAHGALDEVQSRGPIDAHAALGGVHRLGEVKALVPELAAEGQSRVPVHGGTGVPGRSFAQGVGDDVGGGEGGSGERYAGRARDKGGAGEAVGFQTGVVGGKGQHPGIPRAVFKLNADAQGFCLAFCA